MTVDTSAEIQVHRDAVNLRIYLADLTYTQQTIASDVMPAAIGGIAAFAEKVLALSEPIRLFKFPEKLISALEADGCPNVVGFSCYIWNTYLSYAFARAIKKTSPNTVIVFGGPNFPLETDEQERFLRSHPEVDFFVSKEGERAFAGLLAALAKANNDIESVKRLKLPSVHALGKDGLAYFGETIEKIRDLSEIPSPYTSGRMDEFFDGKLLPILQTNRGCPFSCTFCAEGVRFFSKVSRYPRQKVHDEIVYIGRKMAEIRANGGRNDLFIADSNFGMYKEDIDTCHGLAKTRALYQWPEYINVATGKNSKERVLEAAQIVEGAMRLSGSVQSLDPGVLDNVKRKNISAESLMELGLSAAETGANSYSEIILALPGDSKAAHYDTIRIVMDAGFTNIYLFQLMMLQGTELSTKESKTKYDMDCRYRILPRCFCCYELFGEKIVAAEVDEICVANNSLSFEDYLECRRFHLIVTIFYNDGVFGIVLKFLRMLGVSIFRWMQLLDAAPLAGPLDKLFTDFVAETRSELWLDRDALVKFVSDPGHIEQYISGDLGKNLIFFYKTLAITQHIPELVEFAKGAAIQLLQECDQDTPENIAFLADAFAYHKLRADNIFVSHDLVNVGTLSYDISAFEMDAEPSDIKDYKLPENREFSFVMDNEQKALVRRYLDIYGSDPIGIGRIISKVYVKKLFRNAISPT